MGLEKSIWGFCDSTVASQVVPDLGNPSRNPSTTSLPSTMWLPYWNLLLNLAFIIVEVKYNRKLTIEGGLFVKVVIRRPPHRYSQFCECEFIYPLER